MNSDKAKEEFFAQDMIAVIGLKARQKSTSGSNGLLIVRNETIGRGACPAGDSGASERRPEDRAFPWKQLFSGASSRHLHRCHAPRKRGIQYSAAEEINPKRHGVLDRPLSRTMTADVA
ncbi:hypothetical protein [Bradyrhizobium sp. HKCCYLR20261]|uniref:hypothetical protein n=1 Tax=Bradyrhizobium sp. HKCCYLR20261 TaxID=3420760 RepID=UPI003EBC2E12